ncbi:hypothetical protein B7492_34170 (plasmid) [Bacillus mycoides]|uniref:Uncharacterized protein n=1 Tax=Bacillus mycoides TaxID=1405 RepID=A0A1W6AJP9_BACMY|nr:hypothetical protein [Bacillus mycoides]ARJ26078.1 hypothetical protein B7492_34170 [Bacillus mycoides]
MKQPRYRAIFWCRIGAKKSIKRTSFKALKYMQEKERVKRAKKMKENLEKLSNMEYSNYPVDTETF